MCMCTPPARPFLRRCPFIKRVRITRSKHDHPHSHRHPSNPSTLGTIRRWDHPPVQMGVGVSMIVIPIYKGANPPIYRVCFMGQLLFFGRLGPAPPEVGSRDPQIVTTRRWTTPSLERVASTSPGAFALQVRSLPGSLSAHPRGQLYCKCLASRGIPGGASSASRMRNVGA